MTPAPTIQTVDGIKYLIAVEDENAAGQWNDNYSTKDGYYVIHDGPIHLVYGPRPALATNQEGHDI